MSHKIFQLINLSIAFSIKVCFQNFNTIVLQGSKIGIIGRNGSGKSSLLKVISGNFSPSSGEVLIPHSLSIGYVPQIIEDFQSLSGGQRFNKALTQALSSDPDLLLLDEPTNHLDSKNRKSLFKMLQSFKGTLIIVSHDVELLRTCIDSYWHIDDGEIKIFKCSYDDYMNQQATKRNSIISELSQLNKMKKIAHKALMKEQIRAKKSDEKGVKSIANNKWPTIVSDEKARRAVETSGKKKRHINEQRSELTNQLSQLRLPEIIIPKFSLDALDIGNTTLITVSDGAVGYVAGETILTAINFSLANCQRMAIIGNNGSGKTTLIKALFNNPDVIKSGNWYLPKKCDIGYLDQHYNTLDGSISAFEIIKKSVLSWTDIEIRRHLNDFLFRKNEEVYQIVSTLSGGERVRLSLAQIAALTPKLLLLDEITNNLDLETRNHVIQVLKKYPGAIVVISHDEDFLKAINIEKVFQI